MPSANPQAKPAVTPSLPDGIEIFKAGRHIDDAGVPHQFNDADLADMAASYNPALREAPLTVGHPKDNLPAYGWVKGVARNGAGALVMSTHQVEPQFAEMLVAGRFKKRSASFYPPMAANNPTPGKWYLRHVAFLGAQPPAVAGLKDIQFSAADADGLISFSESADSAPTPAVIAAPNQETIDMSEQLKAELAAAQAKLKETEASLATAQAATKTATEQAATAVATAASFAENAKAARSAGFVSFAEGQVKAGKLLPKDKAMAVATLDVLADAAPVEFSEGTTTHKVTPSQWLQDLISNAKPVVSFGEHAPGRIDMVSAAGKTDAEIDAAAHAYARQHKVNYAEALGAVTSFTS